MTTCIVCNNDVDEYRVQISIGSLTPPHQKGDTLATVCPTCGVMRVVGADLEYIKGNFDKPTEEQLNSLNVDEIVEEMVLPNRYVGETLKWIDSDFDDFGAENTYQEDFSNGYLDYGKYNRLVSFLLMDKTTRINNFGPLRCPTIMFIEGGGGHVILFKEGRRRFHLLRYLGATRIPISIRDIYLPLEEDSKVVLYDSKE